MQAVVRQKERETQKRVKKMRRETQLLKLSLTNAHRQLGSPRNENSHEPSASEKSSVFQFSDEDLAASAVTSSTEEDHLALQTRKTPEE